MWIRYPRGEGVISDWMQPFEHMATGKGEKVKDGQQIAILSIGHPGTLDQRLSAARKRH